MIVPRDVCRDFPRSSRLEWLETNGTGAFAMGTVAGLNTRRYHALLVASLRPPVERYVLLSRVEETVLLAGRTYDLGVSQYPGVLRRSGLDWLEEFTTDPCATWRFGLDRAVFEKQVYLIEGCQAVVISYRADRGATLRVRPFLAYRDYHSLSHARADVYGDLPLLEFNHSGRFEPDAHWYYNIEYFVELERGLDFREDLYTPGVIEIGLAPREWTTIRASAGPAPTWAHKRESSSHFVVRRADGRPTILAGYPWFTDWGRDAMIAIPGLLITKGRLDEAREIIEGFLAYLDQGMIPNYFPDGGEPPQYNAADATLWMFQAVRAWLAAGGDRSFLGDVFYPAAKEILDWHRGGTRFGIAADPGDRLLRAGTPQLTWMDAKIGEWVVTPRTGKPVEINALWHGALWLASEWAAELGNPAAGELRAEAQRVQDSFRARFWNPERNCLYDVLTDQGPVKKLRPNQIFAVSLRHGLLGQEQEQQVDRIIEQELLTPVGLRTLERGDPDYQPRYEGSPAARDGAYHQGTVWPWLLGPFIDAYLKAFGETQRTLAYCRGLVERLEAEAARAGCLGSIAEIYDGDEPRLPRGCPAQAWSEGEIARVSAVYGLQDENRARSSRVLE